ncbi:MAG TPA: dihydroorotase [Dehalococcoidia bacterium]|nr:dihydroorotase [Dehalococcoidia bacterium]
MSERIIIRGGRVIDPAGRFDAVADVLIEDGVVRAVGPKLDASVAREIDARGLVVAPGFIDIHTHLRDPGLEYKEDIASGTRAAARGGFTTVCAMPNTQPAMDTRATVEYVLRRASEAGVVRVLPIGAVSVRREGRALAELGDLADAGCIAFSDDGSPVADATLMRRALEYASGLDLPIIDHCEDPSLAHDAVMHEGWVSTRLGLRGAPAAAEAAMVERDIALAAATGGRVHIAHVSTRPAVEGVRRAKAAGVRVTAEVTPHHLTLDDEIVAFGAAGGDQLLYDTNAKVNPPLRSRDDVDACVAGLADSTIDCIATDHAPHAVTEKLCEFDEAAFGISGIETAFGLSMRLVQDGRIELPALIERLTLGAVTALGLERFAPGIGTLAPGAPADVVVLDPAHIWTVEPASFASKGKNTPLAGVALTGAVVMTIAGGRLVHESEAQLA